MSFGQRPGRVSRQKDQPLQRRRCREWGGECRARSAVPLATGTSKKLCLKPLFSLPYFTLPSTSIHTPLFPLHPSVALIWAVLFHSGDSSLPPPSSLISGLCPPLPTLWPLHRVGASVAKWLQLAGLCGHVCVGDSVGLTRGHPVSFHFLLLKKNFIRVLHS